MEEKMRIDKFLKVSRIIKRITKSSTKFMNDQIKLGEKRFHENRHDTGKTGKSAPGIYDPGIYW